jgi:sugar/nucleoside kinase (ribokinase family)
MIVTIGESVYDIIFRNGIPVSSVFGGSMYNVAVSLGRTGSKAFFAGYYANDKIGNASKDFLIKNNVYTKYFNAINDAKSNLALAHLNERGVPSYTFYRDDKLNGNDFKIDFSEINILLVGSFFSINCKNFDLIISIIQKAKENNVAIVYDPNIRNHDIYNDKEYLERVRTIMSLSDFVKMSDEDALHITGKDQLIFWRQFIELCGVDRYVITCGQNPVIAVFDSIEYTVNVPKIEILSTVGAGDATSAGILVKGPMFLKDKNEFLKAVERGVKFGSHVCTLAENFISTDFKTD